MSKVNTLNILSDFGECLGKNIMQWSGIANVYMSAIVYEVRRDNTMQILLLLW